MFSETIILVVKGNSQEAENIARMLGEQYRVIGAEEPEDALSHVDDSVDLVISDLDSRKFSGLELLRTWKTRQPQTPFLAITDGGDCNVAVEAMKLGAADCLVKPVNDRELQSLVSRLVEFARSQDQPGSQRGGENGIEQKPNIDIPPGTSLEDLERAAVEQALAQHHGNRTHAAKTLGISVRTLQRKLKTWGIPVLSVTHSSANNSFLVPANHGNHVSTPFTAHAH